MTVKVEHKNNRIKKFTFFIGIDISRNKLDYAVLHGNVFLTHDQTKNESSEILDFLTELMKVPNLVISKTVFCMEQTGIYSNHLLDCLKKIKANIVIESALHIRNSLGNIRGKYDKIDAIRIAKYAYKCRDELHLGTSRRSVIQQLSHLISLRSRLVELQKALNTPLREQGLFLKKSIAQQNTKLCSNSINALKKDLDEINSTIAYVTESDEHLKRLMTLITSVPGVGPVTATQIIVSTNEFKNISNPKKFACYAGVAPFKKESGTISGKSKISRMANRKIKSLLHIAAMISIRSDEGIKSYYERKTSGEGKPKMAVLNPVRYKLILRIFACLNQDRCYEKDYKRVSG